MIDPVIADERTRRQVGRPATTTNFWLEGRRTHREQCIPSVGASEARYFEAVPQNTTVTTIVPRDSDQLFLLVVGDRVLATETLPGRGQVAIGRAPECDVRIEDGSISRNHAILILDQPLRIVDNSSANGTWVDDCRIAPNQPVEVRVDQAVRLGSVIVIVQRRPATAPQPRRLRTHEYFESRIEDECDRSRTFAIVHLIGDDTARLRELAASMLGENDVIAAYAPGELELLLLGDPTRAQVVENSIEAALEARGLVGRVGSASSPRDGREPQTLVSRARSRAHGQVIAVEPGNVVIADERMRALYQLVAQVAAGDISVLLQGETGVGKEVFAEAIHSKSKRADKPFVKLNCAAFNEALLESELFGHERGAFTGATQVKPGLLEVADGGVVFLDEIGELLPSLQAKLLRVLDERKLLRVGGLTPRPIDVRIVSATNRDLDADVRSGAFRQDLLYRLNAISIIIPPLRERIDEIVPLAGRFMQTIAEKLGRPMPRLSDEAIDLLRSYSWPGNVRELRNVIERAMVLSTGTTIDARDLPEDRMRTSTDLVETPPARPSELRDPPVAAAERQRILDALETCAGNQTHAANLLGISRRTLINKLDKFALPRPRKRTQV
jgi:two-component system, NtrC family, response regulator AtoC